MFSISAAPSGVPLVHYHSSVESIAHSIFSHSVVFIFFGPETLYDRPIRGEPGSSTYAEPFNSRKEAWYRPYVTFQRWDRTPWSRAPAEMVKCFTLFAAPTVILPTLAYSVAFSYSSVLLTVEIPALLGRRYMLTSQGVGLQFIAACIGAILGELFAGKGSDMFMLYRTKRAGGNREAEMRLPFAFPGYLLSVSFEPFPVFVPPNFFDSAQLH